MNIGDKIYSIRKEKGLSISKLAKAVGVSKSTMTSYEKGEATPSAIEINQIASALNVSVETFLDDTEYHNNADLLTNYYDDYKEKNKGNIAFLILVLVIILALILDTLVAFFLKKSPLLSWKVSFLSGNSYVEKGLFMDSYYCVNDETHEITLVQKLKFTDYSCPSSNTSSNKTNKTVISIKDTSKDIPDFICSSATELFYEDDKFQYYFSCTNSSYVIVTYYNNTTENVKQALEKGKIKISDLDEYNIEYTQELKK